MHKLLVTKVNVNTYEEEPFFVIKDVTRDNFDFIYVIEECCQIYKNIHGTRYFFEIMCVDEEEIEKAYSSLPNGEPQHLLAHYIRTHFPSYENLLSKDEDSLDLAKKIIKESKEIKKR